MDYKQVYKKAYACNKCHICIGCLFTLARKHKEKIVSNISKWMLTRYNPKQEKCVFVV